MHVKKSKLKNQTEKAQLKIEVKKSNWKSPVRNRS